MMVMCRLASGWVILVGLFLFMLLMVLLSQTGKYGRRSVQLDVVPRIDIGTVYCELAGLTCRSCQCRRLGYGRRLCAVREMTTCGRVRGMPLRIRHMRSVARAQIPVLSLLAA